MGGISCTQMDVCPRQCPAELVPEFRGADMRVRPRQGPGAWVSEVRQPGSKSCSFSP